MKKRIYTIEEIKEIAKSAIGKTFGELDSYQIQPGLYHKGSHGLIIEENLYDYGPNTDSAPDFEEAGIELKVTPYKKNKNGTLSAKERLVLNVINYMEEYKNTFYTSQFWNKNKMLQILWYLHEDDKPKSELVITDELLFTFPDEDMPIIINDWLTIVEKIRKGLAHEISEADTMYLGACTKGETAAKSFRKQPFSSKLAKQRAFSLKNSYMTQLVRMYIGKEKPEHILASPLTGGKTFEEELLDRVSPYVGKSVEELTALFDVDSEPKHLNQILVARMLGITGNIADTDEFKKANIVVKTIRVTKNNSIIESMSFPTFKYTEIVTQDWEESDLYSMFSSTKFMFAVFKETDMDYVFSHIKFWNMPMSILDNEIKDVWLKTVKVIKTGNIVKKVKANGSRETNFPKMKDNKYCHVRPHAQNAKDTYPLPVRDKLTNEKEYTKHCFWLNNSYVLDILNIKK